MRRVTLSVKRAYEIATGGTRYLHSVAVVSMMRVLAEHYGQDPDLWDVVGILHDIDYDETIDNREKHGVIAAERLKDKLPDFALHAIKSHDHRTGYTPCSALDKALIFTDALEHVFHEMNECESFDYESFQNQFNKLTETNRPWLREITQTYITENRLSFEMIKMLFDISKRSHEAID